MIILCIRLNMYGDDVRMLVVWCGLLRMTMMTIVVRLVWFIMIMDVDDGGGC